MIINKWNEIETKSNNEINKKKITENAGFEPVTPDFSASDIVI